MTSSFSSEDDWKKLDEELLKASHIDDSKGSRMETLSNILRNDYCVTDVNLVRALVALGEATSHIAVHLTNYVDHSYAGSQNKSGDDQLHLDIECDEDVFKAARESGVFHTVASEETPEETIIDENGVFSLGCDPLDGSSVIDANFSVGSIFGIWPGKKLVGRTGREQVASAVSLYGPRTLLCIALPEQKKVFEVTLVKNRTSWEISRASIQIKPAGKIFAPGNLRASNDHAKYNELMQFWIKERYTLRYTGGMVPDGIFTNVSSEKAKAKLRLLYEVAPLGLIIETAGGAAIHEAEDKSVLDITIDNTDHRTGVCFGGKEEVEIFKKIMF